jgi:CheY-like chemotaxis protein
VPLTIVVVDDALDYRLIVRALLAPESEAMIIVGEAANGEEALALVLRERPDIVITDLVMPRLNGVELTAHPGRAATDQDHPYEFLQRRRLPPHGLRQWRGCVREQAGGLRRAAASNPRPDRAKTLRRERPAPAERRTIISLGSAEVMDTLAAQAGSSRSGNGRTRRRSVAGSPEVGATISGPAR